MEDVARNQLSLPGLRYIGREISATPAVGSKHAHKVQQEQVIAEAIGALPAGGGKSAAVAHAKA